MALLELLVEMKMVVIIIIMMIFGSFVMLVYRFASLNVAKCCRYLCNMISEF